MVRFVDSGGESDADGAGLAPVTSLFGERRAKSIPKTADAVRRELEERLPAADPRAVASRNDSGTPRAGVRDDGPIDLDAERTVRPPSGSSGPVSEPGSGDAAERGLLKKLRARQLSVSEARAYLSRQELDGDSAAAIIEAFLDRGYLDDARLAEQIVHAGVDRKREGRQAISRSLAARGVPRDVADLALAELPDDDAERALEFARGKAGSMRALEPDVALRRLAGQLARRGYGGSAALSAARQALDEARSPSGRVRFD